MPLYLLYRLRQHAQMGFSGYEGRYYSLFETVMTDMRDAVNLQVLITALAYKYILSGRVSPEDIPDSSTIESERRQIFFGTAIGLPTFFIHTRTRNRFLTRILKRTNNTRPSRRYSGYTRVHNLEYRRALIDVIKTDGSDLIDLFDFQDLLPNLEARVEEPALNAASGKLMARILKKAGTTSPYKLSGEEFNLAAETCYRESLKAHHLEEAFQIFKTDVATLDGWSTWRDGVYNKTLLRVLDGKDAVAFLESLHDDLISEKLTVPRIKEVIHLLLLCIHMKRPAKDAGKDASE
jgi:hypothetical protein